MQRAESPIYNLLALCTLLASVGLTTGCHSTPAPTPQPKPTTQHAAQYPTRPTTPPPPFRDFHTTANSITLVTADNASDEQIEAILWQLRDAARTHSFDKLHIPQKLVDKRDPIVWFHIYRGPKCASEKYASKLPCGASYHAAGDFTYGGFTDHEHTDGVLLHNTNTEGDGAETHLWNPDKASSS